jgi:hypothetical protein
MDGVISTKLMQMTQASTDVSCSPVKVISLWKNLESSNWLIDWLTKLIKERSGLKNLVQLLIGNLQIKSVIDGSITDQNSVISQSLMLMNSFHHFTENAQNEVQITIWLFNEPNISTIIVVFF